MLNFFQVRKCELSISLLALYHLAVLEEWTMMICMLPGACSWPGANKVLSGPSAGSVFKITGLGVKGLPAAVYEG